MGHDAHFLERLDRVSRLHTELALGLYRDHEAVRHLLNREAVPADAPRVAISLEDERRGPFVVVARDGAFVTCLGEGMSTGGLPVLPRSALDGSLGYVSDMRRRRKVAAQITRDGEDDRDVLGRIFKRKNRLSREEIVGISAFAPLFAQELYILSAKRASEVVRPVMLQAHPPREGVDRHIRAVWSSVYGVELCGTVEERVSKAVVARLPPGLSFSSVTSHLADYTFVLRGIWSAGIVGPKLVESYIERLECALSGMKSLDACLGLAAIALRHESARADILEYLDAFGARAAEPGMAQWHRRCALTAASAVRGAEELVDTARVLGAERYAELAASRLQAGQPGYVASAEEVPVDLAETAYLNESGSLEADPIAALRHLFLAVPLLAKVSVEAFHYPDTLARTLVDPWGEAEVRFHFGQMRASNGAPPTVKYDARIGRNEACPCGSGKKFKRCCAA